MKLIPVVAVVAACLVVGAFLLTGPRHSNQRAESTVPAQRNDNQPAASAPAPAPAVAPPPAEPQRTPPPPSPAPKAEAPRQEAVATRPQVPIPPPAAPRQSPEDERFLSDVQHDKLRDYLDPKAVEAQSVALVTMTGDAEARRYANEIASALNDVGWRVFPGEVAGQMEGVRIRANPKATAAATRLQQALVSGGIDVSLEFMPNVADIQLFVGHRR